MRSNAYRYGFNGKENDNEVKGSGNQQDYGMRIYDPRVSRFLSVDPLAKEYSSLSPYHFASNSPITGIDMDGLEFYYTPGGKFLEHLGSSNEVYTADQIKTQQITGADGKVITTKMPQNPVDLHIDHYKFTTIANIIKHESFSNDPNERIDLSFAASNNAKRDKKHNDMYSLLMTKFSSVKDYNKVPLNDKNNGMENRYARAGVISVLSGKADPTNGAVLWDGADFLAKGVLQNKFKEYKELTIPINLYDLFLNQTLKNYPKGKYKSYSIPAPVFTDLSNWSSSCTFDYTTKARNAPLAIEATAVAGGTIFWKTKK